MSSTHRGAVRNEKDYYRTPLSTVRSFISAFIQHEPHFDIYSSHFLDPCSGGDLGNSEQPYPLILKEFGATFIDTIDIRSDSKADLIGDYIEMNIPHLYDAIFTNPPYDQCQEFIRKALTNVRRGGFVGMLVRLNYYGSIKRRGFWHSTMPRYTFVHSKRPSFTLHKSDSTEYAHMVWQRGYHPKYSKLIVI